MDLQKYPFILIKVGTQTIIDANGINKTALTAIVEEVHKLTARGTHVAIVTSGAIGLGKKRLAYPTKTHTTIREQQGLAAIGQVDLMKEYLKRFEVFGLTGAQLLLSQHDLLNPVCLANIQNTFSFLNEHHIIPIVNENDVVATEELRAHGSFSDNDTLAVLLAEHIGAKLIIMLTTSGGLIGKDGTIISRLHTKSELLEMEKKSLLGRGGIDSKLTAIEHATKKGIDVFVSGAENISGFAAGKARGTFVEHTSFS